jgi:hypothetical protein
MTTIAELGTIADQCHDLGCRQHANARYVGKAFALLMVQMLGLDVAFHLSNFGIQR